MLVEIYVLSEPSGIPRYVGQSRDAKKRLSWHLSAAKRGQKGRVYNWIRSLQGGGLRVVLTVVEVCEEPLANVAEVRWVKQYLERGWDLTNLTEGGSGTRGWAHSPEAKSKIGQAHKSKVVSPETRALLSANRVGKKASLETRQKISNFIKNRPVTDETRRKCSLSKMGNKHPLGVKRSLETRAKMRLIQSGGKSTKAALTDDQAERVRELFKSGEKQADLARRFKVSTVVIHRVVRRKTYRY